MDRAELSSQFLATGALQGAARWSHAARDLLELSLGPAPSEGNAGALKRALWACGVRVKRYLFALQQLSFPSASHGGRWIHLVDGAHAIHKSLFETYVEFALCLTYADLFDAEGGDGKDDLAARLFVFSDFARRKRNRQRLFRLDQWTRMMERLGPHVDLPDDMKAFLAKGVNGVKSELIEQAQRLDSERFSELRHWFPDTHPDGQLIVVEGREPTDRRGIGSVEWQCKAVLAQHFPDKSMREWWEQSYDQFYDLSNLFAHPALGYDDSFRPEAERLLDLARMQLGLRFMFHRCVWPALQVMFEGAQAPKAQRQAGDLVTTEKQLSGMVLRFLLLFDQMESDRDYRGTP